MTTTSSTSSTSGSSILSALNAGSGIDTASLVTSLVSASFDPKTQQLKNKEDANTAKISTLATLSNGVDAFAKALQSLIDGETLKSQVTSSNTSILTAKSSSGASLSNFSAQVEVRQLAAAQSNYSGSLTSPSTAVGTGNLTLTTGTGSAARTFTVTIDSTNNSLSGLAAAINATNVGATPSGVSASIITDSSGARLVVKGATGAANTFSLEADANSAQLAAFATTGTGAQMHSAQVAQDAVVRMYGVDSTYSSNSVSDLVPGVTLTLAKAEPGTTVNLGVQRPTEAVTAAVNDFVSAYNELKGQFDTALSAGSGGSDPGAFHGSPAIRTLQKQLAALASTALTSYQNGPTTLAEIGVKTASDGTMSVDSSKLSSALASYPDAIERMFDPTQFSSSPLIKVTSALGSTKHGTYAVTDVVASPLSGKIETVSALQSPNDPASLVASVTSSAYGLVIKVSGDVPSATVTVEPGIMGLLKDIKDSMRATGGILDSNSKGSLTNTLKDEKTRLASNRTRLEAQEGSYKDQLTAQFTAMQTRVANFKSIQAYMTQQIAIWSKSN